MERRENIPLVTMTPPIDLDQSTPPEYEEGDDDIYTLRAPSGAMLPRE
jgi:hypothetical protein